MMNPPFEESSIPIVGKRYKLINQLGVGGFGQSFLAQDLHLPGCPRCVVKRLLAKTSDPKHLKTARRLFDTEAKVLYQLGKHDQIPSLYAHFQENQQFYLVQELIEGEPLTWQMAKGKQWSEDAVIGLLHDILEILAFVHQRNVIHRDIKPSNLIRRQKDGKLVLIDFGAVKQVSVPIADPDSELADSTVSVGTHGYISNEQLAGRPRFCSDIYAVGMVGIQALTGVLPKQLGEDPVTGEIDWRIHAVRVSPEFAAILDRMVYYDFRDRYPTAIEALHAIKSLPASVNRTVLPSASTADASEQLKLTLFDVDSTQKEPGESPTTHAIAQTVHQDETLIYGEKAPPVNAQAQTQPELRTRVRWLTRRLSGGGHKPSDNRWTWLAGGLAIAGIALVALRAGIVPPPLNEVQPLAGQLVPPSPQPSQQPKSLPPEKQAAILLSQADRLRQQKQYQQALATYDTVLKLQPQSAKAYGGRCESLNGLKQPDKAIVACNDALAINPDDAAATWSKGRALRQQGQILEALRLFEEATLLQPDLVNAWVDQGSALQEVGRSAEAIEALDQAIALNRNSAEAWSIRGAALWNLGRFDQAVASLDKALEIQPNAAGAKALRQQAKEELGY